MSNEKSQYKGISTATLIDIAKHKAPMTRLIRYLQESNSPLVLGKLSLLNQDSTPADIMEALIADLNTTGKILRDVAVIVESINDDHVAVELLPKVDTPDEANLSKVFGQFYNKNSRELSVFGLSFGPKGQFSKLAAVDVRKLLYNAIFKDFEAKFPFEQFENQIKAIRTLQSIENIQPSSPSDHIISYGIAGSAVYEWDEFYKYVMSIVKNESDYRQTLDFSHRQLIDERIVSGRSMIDSVVKTSTYVTTDEGFLQLAKTHKNHEHINKIPLLVNGVPSIRSIEIDQDVDVDKAINVLEKIRQMELSMPDAFDLKFRKLGNYGYCGVFISDGKVDKVPGFNSQTLRIVAVDNKYPGSIGHELAHFSDRRDEPIREKFVNHFLSKMLISPMMEDPVVANMIPYYTSKAEVFARAMEIGLLLMDHHYIDGETIESFKNRYAAFSGAKTFDDQNAVYDVSLYKPLSQYLGENNPLKDFIYFGMKNWTPEELSLVRDMAKWTYKNHDPEIKQLLEKRWESGALSVQSKELMRKKNDVRRRRVYTETEKLEKLLKKSSWETIGKAAEFLIKTEKFPPGQIAEIVRTSVMAAGMPDLTGRGATKFVIERQILSLISIGEQLSTIPSAWVDSLGFFEMAADLSIRYGMAPLNKPEGKALYLLMDNMNVASAILHANNCSEAMIQRSDHRGWDSKLQMPDVVEKIISCLQPLVEKYSNASISDIEAMSPFFQSRAMMLSLKNIDGAIKNNESDQPDMEMTFERLSDCYEDRKRFDIMSHWLEIGRTSNVLNQALVSSELAFWPSAYTLIQSYSDTLNDLAVRFFESNIEMFATIEPSKIKQCDKFPDMVHSVINKMGSKLNNIQSLGDMCSISNELSLKKSLLASIARLMNGLSSVTNVGEHISKVIEDHVSKSLPYVPDTFKSILQTKVAAPFSSMICNEMLSIYGPDQDKLRLDMRKESLASDWAENIIKAASTLASAHLNSRLSEMLEKHHQIDDSDPIAMIRGYMQSVSQFFIKDEMYGIHFDDADMILRFESTSSFGTYQYVTDNPLLIISRIANLDPNLKQLWNEYLKNSPEFVMRLCWTSDKLFTKWANDYQRSERHSSSHHYGNGMRAQDYHKDLSRILSESSINPIPKKLLNSVLVPSTRESIETNLSFPKSWIDYNVEKVSQIVSNPEPFFLQKNPVGLVITPNPESSKRNNYDNICEHLIGFMNYSAQFMEDVEMPKLPAESHHALAAWVRNMVQINQNVVEKMFASAYKMPHGYGISSSIDITNNVLEHTGFRDFAKSISHITSYLSSEGWRPSVDIGPFIQGYCDMYDPQIQHPVVNIDELANKVEMNPLPKTEQPGIDGIEDMTPASLLTSEEPTDASELAAAFLASEGGSSDDLLIDLGGPLPVIDHSAVSLTHDEIQQLAYFSQINAHVRPAGDGPLNVRENQLEMFAVPEPVVKNKRR